MLVSGAFTLFNIEIYKNISIWHKQVKKLMVMERHFLLTSQKLDIILKVHNDQRVKVFVTDFGKRKKQEISMIQMHVACSTAYSIKL